MQNDFNGRSNVARNYNLVSSTCQGFCSLMNLFFTPVVLSARIMSASGIIHRAQLSRSPIFSQDGTLAYNSDAVRKLLFIKLGSQRISKRGLTNWPARFPNLTTLDFFLWGYVKEKVYTE